MHRNHASYAFEDQGQVSPRKAKDLGLPLARCLVSVGWDGVHIEPSKTALLLLTWRQGIYMMEAVVRGTLFTSCACTFFLKVVRVCLTCKLVSPIFDPPPPPPSRTPSSLFRRNSLGMLRLSASQGSCLLIDRDAGSMYGLNRTTTQRHI